MIRAPVPTADWLIYEDPNRRLMQRAHLFDDISGLLPGYQALFAPAARGPLADEAGKTVISEHGLGAWVAPHLAIAGLSHGHAHGRFRPDGWGAEPVPRALQMLRLWDPDGAACVTIGHLHGLRDPSGKGDTPERAAQAHAVLGAMAALARPDEPQVIAGDLNVLPDSETLDILGQAGYESLIARYQVTDTRTALYKKPVRFADYMLVNTASRVTNFEVPANPIVSDHRPMIVDIALK